jgi:APA family basic amino acid/polyamine antiporter
VWVVAPLAVAGCLYLFTSLTATTITFFFAWNAVGAVVYLLWSRKHSRLG